MRYGVVMANLKEYSDPRVAVRLAQAAEEAGSEAFFVWDHLGFEGAAIIRPFLGHLAHPGCLHHPPYAGNGHHAVVRRSQV
jgi:hypothetical protein